MRKIFIIMAMVSMFWFATPTHATLWDRGGGLIYDDQLNITWLQDANYAGGAMTWANAVAWAATLDYYDSVRAVTWSDWQLPTTVDGPYTWGYDGTTTAGYNITTSEMGYMYYENLGNKGYYAKDGTNPQPGWGLTNTSFQSGGPGGPTVSFQNLQPFYYWSATEYSDGPANAWVFLFYDGIQYNDNKGYYVYAWPVRPGDVPEPATMLLLGSGLIGLAGLRKKFKK